MPWSRRQAEALPVRRGPALALAWLSAAAVTVLSLRTLMVELSLPAQLRLDELRLFAVTDFAAPPPPQWLPSLSPDPVRVHSRHAACQAGLRAAVAARDLADADKARHHCLAVVQEALAQSPANGRLWLEKARLLYEISGTTQAFHESLAASWQTAPRQGWVVLERLRFAARLWPFLPQTSKARAAADAAIIASSSGMADALAQEYVRHPLVRPALAEIMTHRLDATAQRRLIRALQKAAP